MYDSGRYVYCIFMCHLCLEKALKGVYSKRKRDYPPKSHSLIYFVEVLDIKLNESYYEFIFTLNKISVPTRYPEDLKKLFAVYTKQRTDEVLNHTKEIQKWIKAQ